MGELNQEGRKAECSSIGGSRPKGEGLTTPMTTVLRVGTKKGGQKKAGYCSIGRETDDGCAERQDRKEGQK